MRSIRHQIAIWLMSMIIMVSVVLSYLFYNEFKQGSADMEESSAQVLQEALVEQARFRIESIALGLVQNLVNPLYLIDMLQIKDLIKTALLQHHLISVRVYDAGHQLLHDGSAKNANYGQLKLKSIPKKLEKNILTTIVGNSLSVNAPIWLQDEYLGCVIILMDLSEFESKQKILHQIVLDKSQVIINNNIMSLLTTLFVFLLLVAFVVIYIGQRLSTPIIELAKHVTAVGLNRHFENIVVSRSDEIGQLQTEYNRMGKNLAESTVSRDFLVDMVDSLSEALLLINDKRKITMSNNAALELFECKSFKHAKVTFFELIPSDQRKKIELWLYKMDGKPIETEIVSLKGNKCMVSISASFVSDGKNGHQTICLFQNITERKLHENKILFLAQYDSLTHLPNRDLFNERLKHALLRADRSETLVALFFIDIDFFKKINDSLGHAAGDELLILIAQRLKQCVRESDTVARLGGDEFTVILENIKYVAEAEKVAHNIVKQLSSVFEVAGQEIHSSLSLGIAYYPFGDKTAESLLKKADSAMYQAKQSGRNQASTYNSQNMDYQKEQLELENELRHVVQAEELELYYQPKVNVISGGITGVEALLRWFHPSKGLISCPILIPMLEELGLMNQVTNWVLKEACHEAAIWQKKTGVSVAVNFTAELFRQNDFVDKIERALQFSGLKPENFMVEITESSLISNIELSKSHIKSLVKKGVSIAIDDFGTGYSSLAYLRTFNIQSLKIDKTFVESLQSDRNSMAICEAIILMAKALELEVVAEGVETNHQYQILKNLGVDEIQGFYFSGPVPKDKFMLEIDKMSRK